MLAWAAGYALPDEATLVEDVQRMTRTMPPVERDVHRALSSHVSLTLSPVWVENEGEACLRMAVMPAVARSRFWTLPASLLHERDEIAMLPAQVAAFVGASDARASVLGDTIAFWHDERAALRRLGVPWKPHFTILSALLADLVRKASAGFDTLEWYASIGVPLDGVLGAGDPSSAVVHAQMRESTDAMIAEEELWRQEALDD